MLRKVDCDTLVPYLHFFLSVCHLISRAFWPTALKHLTFSGPLFNATDARIRIFLIFLPIKSNIVPVKNGIVSSDAADRS